MNDFSLLKKPFFWLILILAAVGIAISQVPNEQVHLVFCNVGQGDASLISYKQTQVLIDGGPNSEVIECLNNNIPAWDRDIEMLVLTHPEADHMTGLIEVVKNFNIKYFVANGIINDNATFWQLQQEIANEGANIYLPKAGDQLKVGDLRFKVLWPEQSLGSPLVWQTINESDKSMVMGVATVDGEMNDIGIALEFIYGENKIFYSADVSSVVEKSLALEDIDILKVAHHGSKYSTSAQSLSVLKPELAVISVGKNSYGHPTQDVLDRLSTIGAKVLRTDTDGEVEITCDFNRCQFYNQEIY